ncbi:MAG: hypothetical protein Q8R53_05645 [Nanoarchaeota archaeon]|nr:hypothetical protein [Nanoarchaeota archaeon]
MASRDIHKQHIEEHLQEVEDALAIGKERRPVTLGFHASACSIELLELYLHVLGKISSGAMLKHEWFKQPRPEQKMKPLAERKLGIDFPHKQEILSLLYVIEEERNKLIYGKPRMEALEGVLKAFQRLHTLIKKELEAWGEEIA